MSNVKRLYRSRTDNALCGVCEGIGAYLGVDTNVAHLLWVLLGLLNPLVSATLYMAACLMLPEEPKQPQIQPYQPSTSLQQVKASIQGQNIKLVLGLTLMVIGISLLTPAIYSCIISDFIKVLKESITIIIGINFQYSYSSLS